MKKALGFAFLGVILAATAPAIPAHLAPKKASETDQQALQGTWMATGSKGFTKDVPAEDLRTLKLTFRGKAIAAHYSKKQAEATFKLNLKEAGPSEMDVTVSEGPAAVKGKTLHGIYLLEGNTLKVAFRDPGKARPADFTDTDRPGVYTIWFKREKP